MRENKIETKSIVFNSNNIRIEDDGLSFYFIFSYFLLESKRQRRQSTIQSQKSHAHMIQGNNVKDSRKMIL